MHGTLRTHIIIFADMTPRQKLPIDSAIQTGPSGAADGRSFTLLGNQAIIIRERDINRR